MRCLKQWTWPSFATLLLLLQMVVVLVSVAAMLWGWGWVAWPPWRRMRPKVGRRPLRCW